MAVVDTPLYPNVLLVNGYLAGLDPLTVGRDVPAVSQLDPGRQVVVHDALDLQLLTLTIMTDLPLPSGRLVGVDTLWIQNRNRLGLLVLSRGQRLVVSVPDVLLVGGNVTDQPIGLRPVVDVPNLVPQLPTLRTSRSQHDELWLLGPWLLSVPGDPGLLREVWRLVQANLLDRRNTLDWRLADLISRGAILEHWRCRWRRHNLICRATVGD